MDTEATRTAPHVERTAAVPAPEVHPEIVDTPVKAGGGAARWVLILLGLGVLGGGAYILKQRQATRAAAAKAPGAERVVPVTVATAIKKDVPIWLEGLGTATPIATVNVKTLVNGPLVSVNFKEGQVVHKGDLLAQVDPRPYEIQLHNAEAMLTRDTAQLRDARMNLERYRTLRTQNLIAQQQLDDQQNLADQYEGTIKGDQASIESAKLNLDYSHITSPIDGVTGVRLIDLGNIVNTTDQTYIVVLTQLEPMAVLFTLPEDDLPRVQQQLAKGTIASEAFSRDGQIKLATGELGLIDNEVNQTTATIRLKSFFPNKDHALWPSEFVKTRLLLSTKQGAIVVPATAVQRGPKSTFIYVVGADDTVQPRDIELASTQGDDAIISKGIEPGDKVVTDGQNQLKAGAKISARTPDPAKSAAAPSASAPNAPAPVKSAGTTP